MCEKVTATRSLQNLEGAIAASREQTEPETLLAKLFKDDLNVDMHPQALRMFIRARWSKVSTLAHNIHGA
jgi:hypothetical protein